jgi:hypothetical protein
VASLTLARVIGRDERRQIAQPESRDETSSAGVIPFFIRNEPKSAQIFEGHQKCPRAGLICKITLDEGKEVTIQGYPDIYPQTGLLTFKADVIMPNRRGRIKARV